LKKICVVVASRANYARIKSFLKAVDEHPSLELSAMMHKEAQRTIEDAKKRSKQERLSFFK